MGCLFGLTIHYRFWAGEQTVEAVRGVVVGLREMALKAGFEEVGEVVEFEGAACEPGEMGMEESEEDEAAGKGGEHVWMKIQTTRYLSETKGMDTRVIGEVYPTRIVAFPVVVGEGAEVANFGLAYYEKDVGAEEGAEIEVKRGWSWCSCCKTQYASDPGAGGAAHFLKCHLGIVAVLDRAKEMGILEEVVDEGKYWELRDGEALAKEVGKWNRMVAGVYGVLRDGMEAKGRGAEAVEGPIAGYRDFERLEMEGREEMEREFDGGEEKEKE